MIRLLLRARRRRRRLCCSRNLCRRTNGNRSYDLTRDCSVGYAKDFLFPHNDNVGNYVKFWICRCEVCRYRHPF